MNTLSHIFLLQANFRNSEIGANLKTRIKDSGKHL